MIVLDTHIWIWWLQGDSPFLPAHFRGQIEYERDVAVSVVSCYEAAWLIGRNRVKIEGGLDEWFDSALVEARVRLLPLTPSIARQAAELPAHHSDPFDRIIIATAVENDAKLLSADRKFPAYEILAGRLNP